LAKHGPTWRDGTALYYALHVDQFATSLGRLLLTAPAWLLRGLTWLTRSIELAAAPLILLPVLQPYLRRIAAGLLTGLHVAMAVTMNLGTFPWVMIATFSLLLSARDWELLQKLSRRLLRLAAPSRHEPSVGEDRGPTRAGWLFNLLVAFGFVSTALDSY